MLVLLVLLVLLMLLLLVVESRLLLLVLCPRRGTVLSPRIPASADSSAKAPSTIGVLPQSSLAG